MRHLYRLRRLLILLRPKIALCFILPILFSPSQALAQPAPSYGQILAAPEYENVFNRSSGWTGADGTYSYRQGSKVVWGFSDTFFGKIDQGSRVKPYKFLHNSVVTQVGKTFSFPNEEQAFSVPDSSQGWFWLFDGTQSGQIFLGQFEGTENNGFGFSQTALWLAEYKVIDDPPKVIISKLERTPHFYKNDSNLLTFGPAVLETDRYCFMYGIHDLEGKRLSVLARAPKESLDQAKCWRFFNGSGWSTKIEDCAPLFSGAAMECSVYQTRGGDYLYIGTENGGLGSKVIVRKSPKPEGPWGEPIAIYQAPEHQEEVFCYNAKAHIQVSDDKKLLLSYNVNTANLKLVESDASIYRPRFFWWVPPDANLLPK